MSLGSRVKDRRVKLGYTQTELAERAEVSTSLITQIEKNRKGVSNTTLANLAIALYTSADYLLELIDEEDFRLYRQSNKIDSELQKNLEFQIYCYNKGIKPTNK